ncbi:hypothetical protein ASPWEDRAFT_48664 [Aspergillus wentii DTO 134E9]|uniref:Serine palmitoyltransferase small subunit A n=1 Tax=Aspergillus wentii DTO 134E9 TaxID=1073089 RepID=A0A1L9RU26_ASPWE|nr:uncharacterized protein ASPWEDRAFT_48664 [Aspergillus wentii DTO 134E9]KAI9934061.1 hypothetical protein MW887_005134 [Aspergillus wentii]OJJ38429.1 hypothetical protein ASPWEDRAFT_48664 [Aspergillus wentii DTO 134E9]
MTAFHFISAFMRWIRLKIYQYEVTFAVYMLTPTEKFIFNSLIISLLTMVFTAAYIYLPDHLRTIYSHMYYYCVGERPIITTGLPSISSVFRESGTQNLEMMYETAKNAAATATKPIAEL